MALTSTISAYDPDWPQRFADERDRLAPIFCAKLIRFEHVGSTAVPGLAAKPEIDMLVEIFDAADLMHYSAALAEHGYRRGGDLSAGHHFFKKDVAGTRTHKLHVVQQGHAQVARMLGFRDHLRSVPAARLEYEQLKLRLEQENTQGIGEYLDGKAPFIDVLLDEIGKR